MRLSFFHHHNHQFKWICYQNCNQPIKIGLPFYQRSLRKRYKAYPYTQLQAPQICPARSLQLSSHGKHRFDSLKLPAELSHLNIHISVNLDEEANWCLRRAPSLAVNGDRNGEFGMQQRSLLFSFFLFPFCYLCFFSASLGFCSLSICLI